PAVPLAPAPSPSRRVPNVITTFAGMDFTDGGGSVPPDTIAAAGPNHIVELVNSTIAIFDRTNGTNLFQQSLATFFASVRVSDCIFDPVVAYDEAASRFYVGAIDLPEVCGETPAATARLLYAVSDSSDPTAGFAEMHAIDIDETSNSHCPPSTPVGGDFTRTGWNADAHVFSFNMFDFPGSCFDHVAVIVIDKNAVLDKNSATAPTIQHIDFDFPNFTLIPARMHDSNPGDPIWLVEESPVLNNNVRIIKLDNLLTTPTPSSTDIAVAAYGNFGNAPQKGGGFTMDSGDTSILHVESRGNRLVATHTVGVGGVAKARFYEFDISGTPSRVQQGTIDPGSGIHAYYPSIAIAANGDLGMTFMQSSTQEFVSMYVTGQLSGDPAGTMQTPMLVKAGERNYTAFDCTNQQGCRAGDYSGITVDPDTADTFCAANEYATSDVSENWGTWIACFKLVNVNDLAVTAVKGSKTAHNGVPAAVTVTIQNRSPHAETITSSDLGDGSNTGLVRLGFTPIDDDGESCGAPSIALNNAKNATLFSTGSKVLAVGKTMKVNFLVTYTCASPMSIKGDPTPNDFSITATVHHDELAGGDADSHPADDMCPRNPLGFDPNPAPKGTVDKGCGSKQAGGGLGGPIVVNVVP
ncbi:MAG TPA: hypothetical protein VI231_16865, partial [Candidatus Binatia bacterium]